MFPVWTWTLEDIHIIVKLPAICGDHAAQNHAVHVEFMKKVSALMCVSLYVLKVCKNNVCTPSPDFLIVTWACTLHCGGKLKQGIYQLGNF